MINSATTRRDSRWSGDALTIVAWKNGTKTNNNKDWKVYKFDRKIGANSGTETEYMRVERTIVGNEEILHAHPILKQKYDELIKK